MQNLTQKQRILAKILSVVNPDPRFCALMRLAQANGRTTPDQSYSVPACQDEGLAYHDVAAIAVGWDRVTGGALSRVSVHGSDEWIAFGEQAARAAGFGAPT